ncbi:DUF6261 family protein [uncultured Draconibacterium sp.]|uniref:DUF6261 family protein n=1 Tax=uncultured Draconibacterium sp. TaxID=1573823 RepID=UPI0032176211
MIEKIIFNSRTTEINAVSMRMIGGYKNTTLSSDVHLSSMFTDLESESALLTSSINRSKAESELDEKDSLRDQQVRALFYLVKGYLHHPQADVKSAAETVEKVLDRYGLNITGESYSIESSLLVSMLDDLLKQKLQDAIALLPGCAEVKTALQTAQTDFETTRVAYEEEKAHEGTEQNATTIKKAVVGIINERIVVYMRAMELVEEPTYGDLARTIATIIAENNEVVKKRRKTPEEETVNP